jgi:hypothetical protein
MSADPAADRQQGRPKDWATSSSYPIMRWPCANLEEKQEPRAATPASANDMQKKCGMT